MNYELKCTSKSQARAVGVKFFFTGKACRHGHDEGRRVQDSRCVICFNKKRKRLMLAWQHRKIVKRRTAELRACWKEILLVTLIRHREALLWRLRKLLQHRAAVQRKRITKNLRRSTPEQRRASRKRNHMTVRQRERAAEHLRRARALKAGGSFSQKDVAQLLWRQKQRCYWCGTSIANGYHVDHIWPLTKGGSNGAENICLACPTCNLTKHNKTPMEFAGRLL